MIKCFASVKTTGTLSWKHGIFEYAFMLADEHNNIIDISFSKMNPGDEVEYDTRALEVSNVTRDIVSTFTPHQYVYKSVFDFLNKYKRENEKYMMVGYEINFCYDFLNNYFKRNAEIVDNKAINHFYDFFYYPGLDVMQLANAMLLDIRNNIPNFKFDTICNAFEVKVSENRSAMNDVKSLFCLYNKLIENSA